jgi:hypothetical protein
VIPDELIAHQREILKALVSVATEADGKATVAKIQLHTQLSRATVYRLFPGGIQAMEECLHVQILEATVEAVKSRLRLAPELTFGQAMTFGVGRLLETLKQSELTAIYRQQPDRLAAYLSRRDATSLLKMLANYSARCAENFGSRDADVDQLALKFMGEVVNELAEDVERDPATWPNEELLAQSQN